MKPDEVVQLLNEIGIPVSVPTLARYVRDGLISEPDRGGHGRGGGRWTEYSLYGVVEAATAWNLLNGKIEIPGEAKQTIRFSPGMIKLARSGALRKFGSFVAGTEGAKFVNPCFVGVKREPCPISRQQITEELYLVLKKNFDKHLKDKDQLFPEWFPAQDHLQSQAEVFQNLLSMLQNAYFKEYGNSILNLLPKAKNIT